MGAVIAACNLSAEAYAREDHRSAIIAGVEQIGRPGVPGPITVFGDNAFAIVTGAGDRDLQQAVIAGAQLGRGRIVAFGHGGYFGKDTLETGETATLMRNAVNWAANPGHARRVPVVATIGADNLAQALEAAGLDVRPMGNNAIMDAITAGVDVIIADENRYRSAEAVAALDRFVRRGGGLVTASLGWGWMQLNPGKDLRTEHFGNQLLLPAGLLWADGYLSAISSGGYAIREVHPAVHALHALQMLEAQARDAASISRDDAAQAAATVLGAVRTIPEADRSFRPRVQRLASQRSGSIVPTRSEPLDADRALDRVVLAMQIDAWLNDPTRPMAAHPAAAEFPGEVGRDVRRTQQTITINPAQHGWHSTGFYAPAGQIIVLRGNDAIAGRGLRLRIGAHSDRNWHHGGWWRAPEITVSHPIDAAQIRLVNPFGGLVYIETPSGFESGPFDVTLGNVIRAPLYVHGVTSLDEWRHTIRHHPAPWAELATRKVILTVPSQTVRELDDPAALMDLWDEVMDVCADLATISRERARPERYVTDVQISAGYMHAGYPIMTHLDAAAVMVDRLSLLENRSPTWDLFHEVGHNHQHSDWTFGGTGEVTVNLFTLYAMEEVCGLPMSIGHSALAPRSRERKTRTHLQAGAPFDAWKNDPFLALIMYVQLREAFGWEIYKQVFEEYRDLPRAERPRNDDEKRDQWMVRFSRAIGHNLGPFFQAWGVPTSQPARDSIADLPVWMPEELVRVMESLRDA